MEFSVSVLQCNDEVECVQVDYAPVISPPPHQHGHGGGEHDSTATEKFVLLADGPFAIRITSHCDIPALVRLEVGDMLGRSNQRLLPQQTIIVRNIQLEAGAHPRPLEYKRLKSPDNIMEMHDHSYDGDMSAHRADISTKIAAGGYESYTSLISDTTTLRILFFHVRMQQSAWVPSAHSPAAVMSMRCGAAKRLARHFGIAAPDNELVTVAREAKKAQEARALEQATKDAEDARLRRLEPWRFRPVAGRNGGRMSLTATPEPDGTGGSTPREAMAEVGEPGPSRNTVSHATGTEHAGPEGPVVRPCARCIGLFEAERHHMQLEVAKWQREADAWRAKAQIASAAVQRERMAAKHRSGASTPQAEPAPSAPPIRLGGGGGAAGPRRGLSPTRGVAAAPRGEKPRAPSATVRKSSPYRPTAEAIDSARQRGLNPLPREALRRPTPTRHDDPGSRPTPRVRPSIAGSTHATRISSTAVRTNTNRVTPLQDQIDKWESQELAEWHSPRDDHHGRSNGDRLQFIQHTHNTHNAGAAAEGTVVLPAREAAALLELADRGRDAIRQQLSNENSPEQRQQQYRQQQQQQQQQHQAQHQHDPDHRQQQQHSQHPPQQQRPQSPTRVASAWPRHVPDAEAAAGTARDDVRRVLGDDDRLFPSEADMRLLERAKHSVSLAKTQPTAMRQSMNQQPQQHADHQQGDVSPLRTTTLPPPDEAEESVLSPISTVIPFRGRVGASFERPSSVYGAPTAPASFHEQQGAGGGGGFRTAVSRSSKVVSSLLPEHEDDDDDVRPWNTPIAPSQRAQAHIDYFTNGSGVPPEDDAVDAPPILSPI
jgi:hypothetical protein